MGRSGSCDRVGQTSLLEVSVRLCALPQHRAIARLRQLLEIVDDEGLTVTEDGDVFFAEPGLRPGKYASARDDHPRRRWSR
jgi:hypothetical protein